jgi:hypothetical protein
MRTTLVVPDLQIPFHDPLMLKKTVQVAKDMQPDHLFQGGELIDAPQTSRWNVGSAGMYAQDLQEHINRVKVEYFEAMRNACPKAEMSWLIGNHDSRTAEFINKYAPALSSLDALSLENLFDTERYGVKVIKGLTRLATNTYALHGHECGGYSSTLSAWDAKFARRYGSDKNFVFFHTHQPGITTRAYGYNGKVTPRWTMNAGSQMDPVAATYVKDGAVSWQMSFAILRDDGKRTYPELIVADDRKFYVAGKRY